MNLRFCVKCGHPLIVDDTGRRASQYDALFGVPPFERCCWSCKWACDTEAERNAHARAHRRFLDQCTEGGCVCTFPWPAGINDRCTMHGEEATHRRAEAEHYATEAAWDQ